MKTDKHLIERIASGINISIARELPDNYDKLNKAAKKASEKLAKKIAKINKKAAKKQEESVEKSIKATKKATKKAKKNAEKAAKNAKESANKKSKGEKVAPKSESVVVTTTPAPKLAKLVSKKPAAPKPAPVKRGPKPKPVATESTVTAD